MTILALEFSSAWRSAAVLAKDESLAWVQEERPRQREPMQLIAEALQRTGLPPAAVERLAVGLGPGSYAGIRSAIAIASGWYLAHSVRLLGVSSLDCMAAQAQRLGLRGTVSVAIDAQRREFYWARYALEAEAWSLVQPLRLASAAEIQAVGKTGEPILTPEAALVGPTVQRLIPSAAELARLAMARADSTQPGRLEPITLRPARFVKAPPPRFLADTVS
jgi:tRNA threonylcarbamoyladenosine biosynthesis protein TsaB